MLHFLQNLTSVSRPRRRRRRSRFVSCEAVETRLVLSAVSASIPFGPPAVVEPVSDDVASQALSESSETARVTPQQANLLTTLPFDSVRPGILATGDSATQNEAILPRPIASSLEIGGQRGTPPNFGAFPANAFDAVFSDFDRIRSDSRPRHARPPLLANLVDGDSTVDVSYDSASATQQLAMANTEVEPLTASVEETGNSSAEEANAVRTDGFVRIPRVTRTTSGLSSLRQDSLDNQDAAGSAKRGQMRLDLSNDDERETSDADDSAIQAAQEFFSRHTDGGFIDAGLDELEAAASIPGAEGTSNSTASLEAGIGRFNPFDDRSHTKMLAAVDLRHDAESDVSQANNNNANANLALASLVVGTVGIGSSSLGRVLDSLRKIIRRMGSVIGIT